MDNFKPDHGENLTERERIQVSAILMTIAAIGFIVLDMSLWFGRKWEPYEWSSLLSDLFTLVAWLLITAQRWYRWKTYEQNKEKPMSKGGVLASAIFATVLLTMMVVTEVLEYKFPAPYVKNPFDIWDILLFAVVAVPTGLLWRNWFTYDKKKT